MPCYAGYHDELSEVELKLLVQLPPAGTEGTLSDWLLLGEGPLERSSQAARRHQGTR